MRLTLVGRRSHPLQKVAERVRACGSEAHVAAADLTVPGAPAGVVDMAVARFGGIYTMVNNAGNVRAGRLEQVPGKRSSPRSR